MYFSLNDGNILIVILLLASLLILIFVDNKTIL